MRWMLTAILLLGAALAISPKAGALLDQARVVREQARSAYAHHYPDLPLWRKTIALGEQAAAADPKAPEVWRFLAEVYTETGWWIRAAEAWRRYLDLGGAATPEELAEVYRNLGYLAYAREAFDEAIGWYRKAIEAKPDDAEAESWLGRIDLELGDPKAALPHWERAAKINPSPKNLYFLRQTRKMARYGSEAVSSFYKGYAAYEKGDRMGAAIFFKRALDLAPDWAEPARWLGRIYLDLGEPDQAVAYWERAIRLGGRTAENVYFLKVSREAVRVGLEAARAYYRGIAAYERGDLEAAALAFSEAAEKNPEYAKAWKWLGRAYYELGRFADAAAAYKRALDLNPDDGQARYFYRLSKRAAEKEAP